MELKKKTLSTFLHYITERYRYCMQRKCRSDMLNTVKCIHIKARDNLILVAMFSSEGPLYNHILMAVYYYKGPVCNRILLPAIYS
jgi:hypothetical protein